MKRNIKKWTMPRWWFWWAGSAILSSSFEVAEKFVLKDWPSFFFYLTMVFVLSIEFLFIKVKR